MIKTDEQIVAMRRRDKDNPNYRGKATDNFEQKLEPNYNGISNTVTTVHKDNLLAENWTYEHEGEKYDVRIRKLTPNECWRLMGFSDEDFKKQSLYAVTHSCTNRQETQL